MSTIRAWIKASRLASQMNIFIPLLIGGLLSYKFSGTIRLSTFVLVHTYGLFMQLYIVYGNDYADRKADSLNSDSTIFSGGSRVLVEHMIEPETLLGASKLCAVLAILVLTPLIISSPIILLIALLGHLLFWMYSFSPIKLNYRGGGEFLQAIGVGLVLPFIGFTSYGSSISEFPLLIVPVLFVTSLASALTSTVPDERADKKGGKNTIATLIGGRQLRFLIPLLYTATIIYFHFKLFIISGVQIIPVALLVLMAPIAKPGTKIVNFYVLISLLTTIWLQLLLVSPILSLFLFLFYFNV